MKLCTDWHQDLGYAGEAPISKHQITNNIQIPISNDQRMCFEFWSFGNWRLFEIWDLDFGIFPPRRDLLHATPG
jgi:hypothetical protein